ncbi:MAG: SCO family protein [Gemmatimonadota bacterium]
MKVALFGTLTMGVVAAAALVAASEARRVPSLPYYADATLTPHWASSRRELDTAHTVGEFSLFDQTGHAMNRAVVANHVYVASFFYSTCRTLCPALRTELARVHDAFAKDTNVLILSHSVTPEADDVGRLAHYARVNGIDDRRWRLLTGSRSEVERLARERYFVELSDTTGNTVGRLRHTETLVLIDGDGHIRGVYDGSLAFEVNQLIKDIRALRAPPKWN